LIQKDNGPENTTDYIIIEDSKHLIERGSGSIPSGAYEIYDLVGRALKSRFDRDDVSVDEAEDVVRKSNFKVGGTSFDVQDIVQEVLSNIGKKLSGSIRSQWARVGETDTVLLSGGGAGILKHHMRDVAHNIAVVEDPQNANARGYHKRAIVLSRKLETK